MPEPITRVVKLSSIPPATRLNLEKGYWDAQVRHLALLGSDEALKFELCVRDGDRYAQGIRSSLNNASAKAGIRVSILIRGRSVYVWRSGTRPRSAAHRPPRKPICCQVCERTLQRPITGASIQYVCPRRGKRNSPCQRVRRLSLLYGITIEEAKLRSTVWRAATERRVAA